ncbi:MAG: fluoride efflux transporter CrcB [Blastocatellia bacterium]|jgi:CrcB protein|nr:fluoride efflux transporter CrcB [Blastocatellia bacterium]
MDGVTKLFAVAAGGAFGAIARYLINLSPVARVFDSFPLSTFLINISGSLAIGFVMAVTVERFELSETVKLALIVGFLGAFTTFSTYEFEIFSLMRERQFVTAFVYAVFSLVTGLVAVAAGFELGRRI